jgi:hypothetical protein
VPPLMPLSAAVDRKNGQVYVNSELHTQTECISRLIKLIQTKKLELGSCVVLASRPAAHAY